MTAISVIDDETNQSEKMKTTPLSGFYSIKNAAATLDVERSQILRYALYDKLPLYMVINGYLPDNEDDSFLVNACAKTTYGQIDVPDELLSLAISIYESDEDEQASGNHLVSTGFDSTNWFPEQATKSDGSVISFDKNLYMYSELSFEDLFINGDKLNRILGFEKKVLVDTPKKRKAARSEVSAIECSDALRILVKLHLGCVPRTIGKNFVDSLKAQITDGDLTAKLNSNAKNWEKYLYIYREKNRQVSNPFRTCIKVLAQNHYGPFSNTHPTVSTPDAKWLDGFYKSLSGDDQTNLTKEQWRNILG